MKNNNSINIFKFEYIIPSISILWGLFLLFSNFSNIFYIFGDDNQIIIFIGSVLAALVSISILMRPNKAKILRFIAGAFNFIGGLLLLLLDILILKGSLILLIGAFYLGSIIALFFKRDIFSGSSGLSARGSTPEPTPEPGPGPRPEPEPGPEPI
ncbi:MAG: hypothetical protein GF383_06685 [Candidatus Lokiarchaeota archaeon]|nr:hypothetical protein [Candidatus Lokiarchaeota archaeon]MBD3339803.1 hypothetical protein [Candidatus Lokiarchaeota archaeon]